MTWISSLFSRYWRNLHLAVILLLSGILIYGNDRLNGYVSQGALVFYQPFSIIKHSVQELTAVSAENAKLRQSLVEAALRLTNLEEAERENARLRAILGFEPPPGYSLLPAKVVSVSGDKTPVSAVINRGWSDNVFVDQPIINREGLVGRISSAGPDVSTVQLLTDPANRVAARVAQSRQMGIVKYVVAGGMILDNFPIQGSITSGDLIVSSGLGGVYPAGLVVGAVASVTRPEEEPFCKVELLPAADFSSLEEVFILRADST